MPVILTTANQPEIREYMFRGVVDDEENGVPSEIKEIVFAGINQRFAVSDGAATLIGRPSSKTVKITNTAVNSVCESQPCVAVEFSMP